MADVPPIPTQVSALAEADPDAPAVTCAGRTITRRELDASTTWMADAIDAFPVTLPGLVSSHLLKGCGHWVQQEHPEDTNRLLIDWLAALPPAAC